MSSLILFVIFLAGFFVTLFLLLRKRSARPHFILFFFILSLTGMAFFSSPARTTALQLLSTEPPSTEQEKQHATKNKELLKAAKHDDLVFCIIDNQVKKAILVDQNSGAELLGYNVTQYNLERIPGGFPYIALQKCTIELRRDETKGAFPPFHAEIGRIILYGLNPPPQHPIR